MFVGQCLKRTNAGFVRIDRSLEFAHLLDQAVAISNGTSARA